MARAQEATDDPVRVWHLAEVRAEQDRTQEDVAQAMITLGSGVARRQVAVTTGGTLVLDAEGVAKAAANDQRVLAHLSVALRRQARVVVSTVTLAEVLRGSPRDAPAHRVLNCVSREPVTEHLGRAAGMLLGATRLPGAATIDAVVAATALDQPGPVLILTSDPGELKTLTQARDDIAVAHV